MRYLIVLAFVFYSWFSFCQSTNKYPILAQELNEAFKDDLLRGIRWSKSFSIDSFRNLSFQGNEHIQFDARLRTVLDSTKEDLPVGSYFVSVYWDLYSDKIYSVAAKYVWEGSFPNYDFYQASPRYGYRNYIKTFKSDIISELGSVDSIKSLNWYNNQWYKEIEILVDEQGVATYLSSNPVVNILDSTKRINWTPAVYYGKSRNSIKSFRLSYEDVVDSNKSDLDWEFRVFVLDRKFKDDLVRFEEESRKIPYGKTVVSFVLNPLTDSFENPFIHKGDTDFGRELIHWIQNYDSSNLAFYWNNYPEAKRVYFYIK